MLMMATAGIFRLEQQEFLNLTEIHSVVTSRIVTAVDLNKSDHTHTHSEDHPSDTVGMLVARAATTAPYSYMARPQNRDLARARLAMIPHNTAPLAPLAGPC